MQSFPHGADRYGLRMSSDYFNNPKHWQARAAEMRAIADSVPEDGIRLSMLKVAHDYEKLAARAIARGDVRNG